MDKLLLGLKNPPLPGAGWGLRGAGMSLPRIVPHTQLHDDRLTGAAIAVYLLVSRLTRKHNNSISRGVL